MDLISARVRLAHKTYLLLWIVDDMLGGCWSKPPNCTQNGKWYEANRKAKLATDLGWDLSTVQNLKECWALVPSVYSKSPILRKMAAHELLALWDFLQPKTALKVSQLNDRFLEMVIQGPPGKIL